MSTTTYAPDYTASATITINPHNVATSATFINGVQSTVVSNLSTLYADVLVSGVWTAGTTPTINTQVQIWVFVPRDDDLASTVVYPAAFSATAAAAGVLSAGALQSGFKLGAVLAIDSTTSNLPYDCAAFSVAALYGGRLPTRWGLYITHNTGVNSNSTAGNHTWTYIGLQDTATTV